MIARSRDSLECQSRSRGSARSCPGGSDGGDVGADVALAQPGECREGVVEIAMEHLVDAGSASSGAPGVLRGLIQRCTRVSG